MLRSKMLPLLRKYNLINATNKDPVNFGEQIPVTSPYSEEIAIEHLKLGHVIAVPTDTVYGLACDATNVHAISSLYDIKSRNKEKPLAICLGNIVDLNTWANVQHIPINLLHSLLPGPVTLILESINETLDSSLCLEGKVGIRIPDHLFIRNLSQRLKKPLALTSANLSSEPSARNILEFKNIWNNIPVIFDSGTLNVNNMASTIVDLSLPGLYKIVREGAALDETVDILQKFSLKENC